LRGGVVERAVIPPPRGAGFGGKKKGFPFWGGGGTNLVFREGFTLHLKRGGLCKKAAIPDWWRGERGA